MEDVSSEIISDNFWNCLKNNFLFNEVVVLYRIVCKINKEINSMKRIYDIWYHKKGLWGKFEIDMFLLTS